MKKHIVIIACVKGISRATPRTPPAGPGGRKTINEGVGLNMIACVKGISMVTARTPRRSRREEKQHSKGGGLDLMETVKIIKEYI
jgi:hypothetical protein